MRFLKGILFPLAFAACSGGQSGSTVGAPEEGSSAPSSVPAAASAATSASTDDPAKTFVEVHNRYRASHCAQPLEWSADVAKVAQSWANELAHSGCKLRHSKTNLGENLAAGTAGT